MGPQGAAVWAALLLRACGGQVHYSMNFAIAGHVVGDNRGVLVHNNTDVRLAIMTEGTWHPNGHDFDDHLLRGYQSYFSWLNTVRVGLTVQETKRAVTLAQLKMNEPFSVLVRGRMAANAARRLLEAKIIIGPMDAEDMDVLSRALLALGASDTLLLGPSEVLPETLEENPMAFRLFSPPWPRYNGALRLLAQRGGQLPLAVLWEDARYQRFECRQLAEGKGAVADYDLELRAAMEVKVGWPAMANSTLAMQAALLAARDRGARVLVGCFRPPACRELLFALGALAINFDAVLLGDCVWDARLQGLGNVSRFVVGTGSVGSHLPWGIPKTTAATPLPLEGWQRDEAGFWLFADELWDSRGLQMFHVFYHAELRVRHHSSLAMLAAYMLSKAILFAGSEEPSKVREALLRMYARASPAGQPHSIAFDPGRSQVGLGTAVVQVGEADLQYVEWASELMYPKPTASMLRCMTQRSAITRIAGFGVDETGACLPCVQGRLEWWDAAQNRSVCRYCEPGHEPFALEGTQEFICMPCAKGFFGVTGAKCEFCPKGTFAEEANSTFCGLCPAGKFGATTGASACRHCDDLRVGEVANKEFYSAYWGSPGCRSCPEGGLCPRNSEGLRSSMTNLDGYFLLKDDEGTYQTYPCLHAGPGDEGSACLSNERCFMNEEGEETMTGPFCGVCKPGWGRDATSGLCRQCPTLFISFLYMMVLYLALLAMCMGLTFLVLVTDFSKPKNQVAIILKICLSYVQLLTSVLPFVTFWEDSLFAPFFGFFHRTFSSYNSFVSPWISVVGFSCFCQKVFPSYDEWKVRTLLGLLFIPCWMTQVCFFYLVYCVVCHVRGKDKPGRTTFTSICIANLFVVHPRCNEILLEIFRCKVFENSRMVQDTRVLCNTAEHQLWQIINGVGLCVYSLGIPLTILVMLVRVHSKGMLRDIKVIRSLGFMYAGFEPACYYFEPMLMIRRILFPVLAARAVSISPTGGGDMELGDNEHGTVLALLALNILFLFIHAALQPFDNRSYFILDRIEDRSLWAILSLLLSQAFSKASNNSPIFNGATAVWAMLMNFRFFFLLMWGLGFRKVVERVAMERGLVYFQAPLVKITERGFDFSNVQGNAIAEESLATIFAELVHFHMLTHSSLSYRSLVTKLQRMNLVALQSRVQDTSGKGVFEALKKFLDRSIDAGLLPKFVSKHLAWGLDRGEAIVASAVTFARRRAGSSRNLESRTESRSSQDYKLYPSCEEADEETGHGGLGSGRCRSRLMRTYELWFTVEELHRALLISMRQSEAVEKAQERMLKERSGSFLAGGEAAEPRENDFGDEAIAKAMGTPTLLGAALPSRQQAVALAHRFINEGGKGEQPIQIKGSCQGSRMPPLRNVLDSEAELRGVRARLRERAAQLEKEKLELQAQIEQLEGSTASSQPASSQAPSSQPASARSGRSGRSGRQLFRALEAGRLPPEQPPSSSSSQADAASQAAPQPEAERPEPAQRRHRSRGRADSRGPVSASDLLSDLDADLQGYRETFLGAFSSLAKADAATAALSSAPAAAAPAAATSATAPRA